eukprot:Nitzschia sp. Nitz4//scaffold2_size372955//368596//371613//NITZ4_000486-RA/size372955-processed-gene-0.557-mRNA-1//-1//CDS//3329546967//5298//frame0
MASPQQNVDSTSSNADVAPSSALNPLAQLAATADSLEAAAAAEEATSSNVAAAPRGKPEAMAAKLSSAARLQAKMEELESEVIAEPLKEGDDGDMDEDDDPLEATMDTLATIDTAATDTPKPAKKKRKTPTKKKAAASATLLHPTMEDPVVPITDQQYLNLEKLMVQFCRVPLLAEFSRPVALLHPELMSAYSKIVEYPVDLGLVCRKIRKRSYENLRDVRLDAWRIFSNCIRYHSHPSNKEAVPSFVSIALHLRAYFNDLWQEYMMASDPPADAMGDSSRAKELLREALDQRQTARAKRLLVSGLSVMTGKSLTRAADTLGELIQDGGCVDRLDTEPVWGDDAADDSPELDKVVDNLRKFQARLVELSSSGADYGIDELERDLRKCYQGVVKDSPDLEKQVGRRLDRWIGQIVVPIHEATCRGVSQSSIWGCMAAAVWARESSKKPFWPALVLGIMAPEHQREQWHLELTLRNEARLPDKLKQQLVTGKRKAESWLKKHSLGQTEAQSFFLVEFLGTHEFIWVREADIVEDFDPAEDPNQATGGNKKKRAGRTSIANVIGSKTYAAAIEEAQWALEEFELQLQDIGNDGTEEDDEGYSYPVLCQSDDEADQIAADSNKDVNLDVLNELLATNGLIDLTSAGRKNAKKRAIAIKKQKETAEKRQKADKAKKLKAEQTKKKKDAKARERENKKEQKDLEKKRKKRARERERALKSDGPLSKRRKLDADDKKGVPGRRNVVIGKRERATAIVEGYLDRAVKKGDYKTLCLGGMLSIPAALIDSNGLLGMALAFRAAAGELPMPEESGTQDSNLKPWDAIKVSEKKKSAERKELLEKQVKLLEEEIARLRKATETRKSLAVEVRKGAVDVDGKILEEDKKARENPLKKRKSESGKGKERSMSVASEEPATPGDDASMADSEGDVQADTHDEDAEVVEAEAMEDDVDVVVESVEAVPKASSPKPSDDEEGSAAEVAVEEDD